MGWMTDLVYSAVAVLSAPVWAVRMLRTGKMRTDWRARFGHGDTLEPAPSQRLLIHAVSVGEVNGVRTLVDQLLARPPENQPSLVISSTTDTGFARAVELYGSRCQVVRYPFDFSWMVRRFLDRVRPDAVALFELECWPNFIRECERRGIPVGVINGRLTERSARRYRLIRPLIRSTFSRLAFAAVQNASYADRFVRVGVPQGRVLIAGNMKWDNAVVADAVEGADELAAEMGIDRCRPLVVAGSTAPGEHELLHRAVPEGVQLLCAPRKPEWFDEAARTLQGCARRSTGQRGSDTDRFLLDTIGELRKAYALADVVVVGRSFGNLYGSDMMEPVALGKPTIVGPAVVDFEETVDHLLAGDGLIQTSAEQLPAELRELLARPQRCRELGENGRAVVRAQQGAVTRQRELLLGLLAECRSSGP